MASLLKGVGFITGAASGIGKATAFSFARHGAKAVAIADLNAAAAKAASAELKKAFPNVEVLPLELNVADEKSVDDAVAETVRQFGRIDYAVNNAGIGGTLLPSSELSLKDWQKVQDVNLNGVWLSERAEIRQMLKQEPLESNTVRYDRGAIVNMASVMGVVGAPDYMPIAAYVASKHAVVGFTKTDATAYAKQGVRINALCPGYVATPLLSGEVDLGPLQKEIDRTPLGRLADPDEIADSVTFLVSPLSSYVHGSALVVDGGFTSF